MQISNNIPIRLSEKGHKSCINQIHLIKSQNIMKIQFNHFIAWLYLQTYWLCRQMVYIQ